MSDEPLTRFDECFDWLMQWEGEEFEDDENDPGGATKYGIDQRSHPDVHIEALTRDHAKAIYRQEKWEPFGCEEMPAPWDLLVLNFSVNPGEGWIAKALQNAVGAKADGWIGRRTLAKVNKAGRPEIEKLIQAAEQYYNMLPDRRHGKPFASVYLKGWLARVSDVRSRALRVEEIGVPV